MLTVHFYFQKVGRLLGSLNRVVYRAEGFARAWILNNSHTQGKIVRTLYDSCLRGWGLLATKHHRKIVSACRLRLWHINTDQVSPVG